MAILSKPTLLIDADLLVYKFAFGHQETFVWSEYVSSTHTELDAAIIGLDAMVEDIAGEFDWAKVVMALSDPERNFRQEIYPGYKSNRKPEDRPLLWEGLRDYITGGAYKWYQKPGLEGDDVLGILATHPSLIRGDKVIVSTDKDMKTVPGHHYNLDTKSHMNISEEEADYWHLFQTLTGDVVDQYPGCPTIGAVRAKAILEGATLGYWNSFMAWRGVVAAFEKRGLTKADALVQARLARILRATDYDFDRKEPILWMP